MVSLAAKLLKILSKKHDVVVIEKEAKICEEISAKYGAIAIQGDATNIRTLRDAGIEKADYALGVMRYDPENLLFSLLAKNHNVPQIFVRMRDPEYEDAYLIAGATNIAASVNMMVTKFVLDIENPEIRRVASLRNGKAEVSIITLPEKAKHDGMTISEIVNKDDFPDDCIIAGIFDQKTDQLIIPRGNRKFTHQSVCFYWRHTRVLRKLQNFYENEKQIRSNSFATEITEYTVSFFLSFCLSVFSVTNYSSLT